MINIIKWIIIELIILKKIFLKLILGTVWQSYRLSYRTWFVIPCLWHDISSIVIPNCVAWQCYTLSYRFGLAWQCDGMSYRSKVVWHYLALSYWIKLNLQVICHAMDCHTENCSMTMSWYVIPISISAWHELTLSYWFQL